MPGGKAHETRPKTIPAGSCLPGTSGCNSTLTADGHPSVNFNARVNLADGSCRPMIKGCMLPYATNYRDNQQRLLLSRGRPTASSSQFSAATHSGPSYPALFASRSVRRALLTSQVNPGSLYRCSRST